MCRVLSFKSVTGLEVCTAVFSINRRIQWSVYLNYTSAAIQNIRH